MSSDFQRQLPGAQNASQNNGLYKVHLDPILLALVCVVLGFGLMILFSAAGEQTALFDAQFRRVLAAMAVLVIAAQLPPGIYLRWAPVVYVLGLVLLVLVLLIGVKVKGSQRWLEIPGVMRFQPSELMKIAVPMALAWYLQQRVLPPSPKHIFYSLLIIALPCFCNSGPAGSRYVYSCRRSGPSGVNACWIVMAVHFLCWHFGRSSGTTALAVRTAGIPASANHYLI
jgi:hypothetical protein